jgi:hypothetical protein
VRQFKRSFLSLAAWALPALLMNGAADAHHSGAMFDFGHCRSMEGTVRTLEWNYPHNWLWIIVLDSQGADATWGFEFMSPTQAAAIDPRWTKTVLKKGDKVTVKFAPLKDGRNGGALSSVTLPDGRTLSGSPSICDAPSAVPATPGK